MNFEVKHEDDSLNLYPRKSPDLTLFSQGEWFIFGQNVPAERMQGELQPVNTLVWADTPKGRGEATVPSGSLQCPRKIEKKNKEG